MHEEWDEKTCIYCGSTNIEQDPEIVGWYDCNACGREVILCYTIWKFEKR